MDSSQSRAPTLEEFRDTERALAPWVRVTPLREWPDAAPLAGAAHILLKEELFQHTGSFKARGALSVMQSLDRAALDRGVTAVSAGNHAIAVAWAARLLGSHARVVMPTSASVFRRAQCEALGGQVELADSVHDAFSRVQEIVAQDGRRFVHPYEGPLIARGTGTLGLEIVVQCATLQRHPDAIVVASGGGGLTAGLASAVRQLDPSIAVYAVEPYGADSLWRSLAAGSPQPIAQVRTIADSLGAPRAEPYSFMLNQAYIRDVVRVHDAEIVVAMRALLEHAKLAVEPAGAAALAAVCGPLASRLSGKTVVVLVCGANIGAEEFARLIA